MKNKHNIQMVEYSFLYPDDNYENTENSNSKAISIDPVFFKELKQFVLENKSKGSEFLKISHKKEYGEILQAQQYVGVLQSKNGTTLEILPKITDISDASGLEKSIAENKTDSKPKQVSLEDISILICEDNETNQMVLEMLLEDLKITDFEMAENGLVGYEKYINNPDKYDIILMDINMPKMDGEEATKNIIEFEQKHNLPHTPIVALTANALLSDRNRYLSNGFDGYLSKPIDENSLVKAMQDMISSSSKRLIQ